MDDMAPRDGASSRDYLYVAIVIVALVATSAVGAIRIGPIVIVIVCGSGFGGLIAWLLTTFRKPADPARILFLYLLTLAALMVHITEEYLTHFPQAMSEAFSIEFSEAEFVVTFAMVGFVVWIVAAIGIYCRHPLGNYVCWFMFIGMGFGEATHFLFPLRVEGPYRYFPGMWTAILPSIPAWIGMYRLVADSRSHKP